MHSTGRVSILSCGTASTGVGLRSETHHYSRLPTASGRKSNSSFQLPDVGSLKLHSDVQPLTSFGLLQMLAPVSQLLHEQPFLGEKSDLQGTLVWEGNFSYLG